MDKLIKNKKGFTYILIVVIFITFISFFVLLIKPVIETNNNVYNFSKNYIIELENLIEEDLNIDTLNNLNNNFYYFLKSHNYDVDICTIVDDGNNSIYLSNYLNVDVPGVAPKQTSLIEKDLNLDGVSLGYCNLSYDSSNKVVYYIELRDDSTKTVYKNFDLENNLKSKK
jgi:hypothetical protein